MVKGNSAQGKFCSIKEVSLFLWCIKKRFYKWSNHKLKTHTTLHHQFCICIYVCVCIYLYTYKFVTYKSIWMNEVKMKLLYLPFLRFRRIISWVIKFHRWILETPKECQNCTFDNVILFWYDRTVDDISQLMLLCVF